ncbi:MAG: flp pilus-assembly TadE/G-like family protein [Actinomycetota bacterium]|nr:flp pilus-assembly TadE/G-like family protein [Actinomycetota bacterium]
MKAAGSATGDPAAAHPSSKGSDAEQPGSLRRRHRPRLRVIVPTPPGSADQTGSATAWVLTVAAVMIAAATALLGYAGAVVARHRAESAADLAALSAASTLHEGTAAACVHAARVAGTAGGRLMSCRVTGQVVDVEVRAPLAGDRLAVPAARARARAGPVRPEGG